MIVTFVGHSSLRKSDELFRLIKETICDNIDKREKNIFYCGGYGDFDEICRSVCCELKKDFENIEIVFVTPYFSLQGQKKADSFLKLGLYDSFVYPELENVPLKFAIEHRNRWMVENADLIISYVEKQYGGAYKTFSFAKKRGKRIINLSTVF